ncbi:zinc ribbon domain-containing protein [Microvirga arsenatis]|uniref:Transposase n=1 Tax=Microvirga arsenatis TaxID=2692265 RepID=A0ABW9Z5U6_9HYPH|nr:zinc ribbon domain-containing protein [Microvirga arsenatis]NBJ13598.1 hypothetical protein [Microvirga arsenatis]NBJ27070.1 hypothetical protein [Microvirga arsenatis]
MEENQLKEITIRQYGLLSPLDWGEDCEEELLRMNQLWNRLAEIEQVTREKYNTSIMTDQDVESIYQQIASSSDFQSSLIKERRSIRKQNGRKVETHNLDEQIRDLSHKIADLRNTAASSRKLAREKAGKRIRALEVERRAAVKLARQESGLWWGNYNAIVKAYERGRRIALRNGGQLQFKRYDGTGRIVNQIQGGMTVADLFGATHSQIAVDALPGDAWTHPSRGERRRLQRTRLTATIFVRSGERRTVTWPMIMHRPIPEDCLIKEVVVTRRKLGPSWQWQVTFTCTRSGSKQNRHTSTRRVVAVDLGWRRLPEGIRVATVVRNDDTPADFMIVPADIVDGFALIKTLQSRRDTMKNNIIAWLKTLDWAAAPEALTIHLPALQDATFISAGRVASLAIAWRNHQDWDAEGYRHLEKWRLADKRLWLWEVNQREKLIARRTDLYRRLSYNIVVNTDVVVINHLEIEKMSRLLLPEGKENPLFKAARHYRTVAAPSYLRKWIEIQARKIGATVVTQDMENWVCHACGAITMPARPYDLQQTCAHCGITCDRDMNTCRVMLKSFNR